MARPGHPLRLLLPLALLLGGATPGPAPGPVRRAAPDLTFAEVDGSGRDADGRADGVWTLAAPPAPFGRLDCGGGADCEIALAVDGDLALSAGSGIEAAGGLRLEVAGDLSLAAGAYLAALDGNVRITVGGHARIDGLVSASGGSGPGAGTISIRSGAGEGTGIHLGPAATVVSEGGPAGANAVELSGCGIAIDGLVAAVAAGPGVRVSLDSCEDVRVGGRIPAAQREPGQTGRGRVEVSAAAGAALVGITAEGSVHLDGGVLRADGGPGAAIAVTARGGEISWRRGAGSVGPPARGAAATAGGRIRLAACHGVDLLGSRLEPLAELEVATACEEPREEPAADESPWMAVVLPEAGSARVGISSSPACTPDLMLSGQTITIIQEFVACNSITADNFRIIPRGYVTFRAGQVIILDEGFSVEGSAFFQAILDPTLNSPPVAQDDAFTINEDSGALAGNVLVDNGMGADSDADGDPLTVSTTPVSGPTDGMLTLMANGDFTYTPNADFFGMDMFEYQIDDGNGATDVGKVTITVDPVNDAPSFAKGPDQIVNEDAGPQMVAGWATAISAGPANEAGQALTFNVTGNTNPGLFSASPAVNAAGDLSYTPAADANGSADVTIELMDDGGTANGGVDTSAPQTFTITVSAVNDAPSFTKGPDEVVDEDAGPQNVAGWATAIAPGPADEAGQTLTFNITNNTNPGLFSAGPAVNAAGDLSYTPAADASGSADLTIELMDDGGTANGGVDTSAPQTFTITVNAVNDAPSFTKGPDQVVNEDAGVQNVAGWATAIAPGPANEAGQTLTFNVTNNTNPGLFSAGPAVNAAGDLSYTPAADANGSADVTIELMDDGGTANGGIDTSGPQTFTITVNAVNDAPSFTKGPDEVVDEDAGPQNVAGWATAIAPGPADEAGQTLTFNVTNNTNPGLFSAGPAVNAAGDLSYTPALNANGSADVTIELMDDGGTANGGVDTSAGQTFTITVNPVNDPPVGGADAYDFVGNTLLLVDQATSGGAEILVSTTGGTTPAADGVLDNDSDPIEGSPVSVSGVRNGIADCGDLAAPFTDCPTFNGGKVTVEADGRFSFTPRAGDNAASDSFEYRLSDGTDDVIVAVTLNRKNRVWYVQNDHTPNADPGDDGTSSDPFTTLAGMDSAESESGAGDTIYVFSGDGTTSGQNAGITLKMGQRLLGEGVDLTVPEGLNGAMGPTTLFDSATNPKAKIENTGGDGVTVDASAGERTGIEIHGLDVAGSGNAIDVTSSGANPVGVTIADNRISDSTDEGIDLNHGGSGLFEATVENNSFATSSPAGNAIDVVKSDAGNAEIAINDNVDVTSSGGTAIRLDGTAGTGTLFVTGFSGNSVHGNTAAGGISIDAATFDADTGTVGIQQVAGGATAVGSPGNPVTGFGIRLATVKGSLAFADLDVFNDVGTGLEVANAGLLVGDFTLATTTGTIATTTGAALDLDPLTAAVTLASVTTSGIHTTSVRLADLGGTVDLQGGSLAGSTGTAFNVLRGSADVTYSGTAANSSGLLIDVQNTTAGTVLFDGASLTSSGAGADTGLGIRVADVAGNVTVDADATTISSSDGTGILVSGSVSGTVTINDTTITSPAAAGVSVDGGGGDAISGTVDLNNVDVTTAGATAPVMIAGLGNAAALVDLDAASALISSGDGIRLDSNANGTISFNGPATLNTGSDSAVNGTANGSTTVNFAGDLDLDTTTGTGFNFTGGGTVNVTGGTTTVTTVGTGALGIGIGVSIGAAIGSGGVTFDSVDVGSAGKANSGILLANTGAGSFTVAGGTIQNTTTDSFEANNVDGTVAVGASLENDGGRTVEISGSEADFTFSGAIDENALGIRIAINNTGTPTFTFNGGLDVDTIGTNIGVNAFSGGTLSVCADTACDGTGAALVNTIDTTAGSGAGLIIDGVALGSAGVTFQSIDVGTIAGGPATGIDINNAGTSGSFEVTGTGANPSGGVIRNTAENGIRVRGTDNITLRNMDFLDAAADGVVDCTSLVFTGCRAAVELENAGSVDLVNVDIVGSAEHGLFGQTVTDLDLTNVTVTNAGQATSDEHGIYVRELKGTANDGEESIFDNVDVTNSGSNGIFIENTTGTTALEAQPDLLIVRNGSSLVNHATNSGLIVESDAAAANLKADVQTGTQFTNNTSRGISANANAGRLQLSVNDATFGGGGHFQAIAGGSAGAGANSELILNITNNNITQVGAAGTGPGGIVFSSFSSGANDGTMRGTIQGNTINSATSSLDAIALTHEGDSVGNRFLIDNNNITLTDAGSGAMAGMNLQARASAGRMNLRISNNTVSIPNNTSTFSGGIAAIAGNATAGETNTLCIFMASNNVATPAMNAAAGGFDLEYQVFDGSFGTQSTTVQVEGLSMPFTDANLETHIETVNTAGGTDAGITAAVTTFGGTLTSGTCTAP